MPKLSKVEDRAALAPRRDPYWERISKGCYLGFRKLKAGSSGTWLARYRDEESHKQEYLRLGDLSEHGRRESERFDEARKRAEAWFKHKGAGGLNGNTTIADVCAAYAAQVANEKGEKAAKDIRARFKRYVLSNKRLAATKVMNLKPKQLLSWRQELQQMPAESGPNRGKPRSDITLNRDMTCLRAALNLALENREVMSDAAWVSALKPVKATERQRDLYLDRDQRRALIDAASDDLGTFLRALCQAPIRPGALAELKVANLDAKLLTLTVSKDKAEGHARKIALPDSIAGFFLDCARDALPSAPLLRRADGKPWNKDAWKGPVRAAVAAARLPSGVTAYTLRHSVITDLVHDGVDLLTVAQLAGTSLRMIEKHYGHLTGTQSRKALESLAL